MKDMTEHNPVLVQKGASIFTSLHFHGLGTQIRLENVEDVGKKSDSNIYKTKLTKAAGIYSDLI